MPIIGSEMSRQGHSKLGRAVLLVALIAISLRSELMADSVSSKAGSAAPKNAKGFDHQRHAKQLEDKNCSHCHIETDTARPAPTTRSHAPCLASECHIDEFLSTGPRTKKEDRGAFATAAEFCALCHKSRTGEPPRRFAKAPANALFEDKTTANFHVEMDHQAHSLRTRCSTCHVVDIQDFTLVAGRPNHLECKSCHDDSEQPMSDCEGCHRAPGPATYFTGTRKRSDVRVCVPGGNSTRPCFKHERTEHRFQRDQSPLECSSCHYMFKKKKYNGQHYTSLADIKAAPIIDNRRDMAHRSCGTSGCHKREIDDSMGTGKCGLCHSKQFMASSLID